MIEFITTVPNGTLNTFFNTVLGKIILNSGRVLLKTDVSIVSDFYKNDTVEAYFPTMSSLRYVLNVYPSELNEVLNSITVKDTYTLSEWLSQTKYK